MKQELIRLIQYIPYGMVVSYGELAIQLDIHYSISTSGWMVGRILSNMSDNEWSSGGSFPWWRVVNKQGMISALKLGEKGIEQIKLLQKEGIQIVDGVVDMKIYEYNFIGL